MKKSVIVISVILLVVLALLAVGFLYLQERQSAAEVTDPSVVATEPPTAPATEPEVTEPEVTEPATEPEATEPTTQTESTEPSLPLCWKQKPAGVKWLMAGSLLPRSTLCTIWMRTNS